jgi:hypothetical protein
MDEIVKFSGNDIIKSVDDLMRLGTTLIKSGFVPLSVKSPEAAVAIILKGREIGIGPMESLSSINVIQGKPTTSPQLMMALARRTKELEDFKIDDDGQKCTVTIKRKNQTAVSTSFSMDDAKAMGLANKDNWNKQPKTMRQWRAVAANLRITFPDAIAGLYTYEEMGAEVDVTDEGQMTITKLPEPVIEGKATVVETEKTPVNSENNGLVLQILATAKSQFGKYKGHHPTKDQAQKLAGVLTSALDERMDTANKEQWRHAIYHRVAGVVHGEEMDLSLAATLQSRWGDLQDHFKCNDRARSEVAELVTLITKEHGQAELPL